MKVQVLNEVREGRPVTVVRRPKTAEEKKLDEIMKRLAAMEKRLEQLEQRP